MQPFSLTVLMYHYVRDPGDRAEAGSGIPGLSRARFEAQLDYAARHYAVVAWPDVRACVVDQKPLPRNACLLTFDDGVCDHYLNVFPALRARGLSGLFFALARPVGAGLALGHKIHFLLARLGLDGLREAVGRRLTPAQRDSYTQAERHYQAKYSGVDIFKSILQRDLSAEAEAFLSQLTAEHLGPEVKIADRYYLTPDQVAAMRAGGMHFGGHSRTHPWFDWVSADQQAAEINASAGWLQEIEPGPWAFAYPYGGWSAESPELLRGHGFAAAFTTISQVEHTDPFFIGRLDGEELSTELTPRQPVGAD